MSRTKAIAGVYRKQRETPDGPDPSASQGRGSLRAQRPTIQRFLEARERNVIIQKMGETSDQVREAEGKTGYGCCSYES